jgi:hypothetical protein
LDAAEARFGVRDKPGVLQSAAKAREIVPCLNEEVNASTSARFHRVQGFSAYLEKQTESARLWFAASRMVQPAYALPSSLVPEGHPLHQLYTTSAAPIDTERIAAPAGGEIRFDGKSSLDRPLKRPSLYQYIAATGQVEISQVLEPGLEMKLPSHTPLVATAPPVATPVAPAKATPSSRKSVLRTGLLAGSGAALVGAGVLYAAALNARTQYQATPVVAANRGELEQLYKSNRTLATTSGICAGTALSLGIGAVLVGRW